MQKVSGTFPFDTDTWTRVRYITVQEAARLTGIDISKYPRRRRGALWLWENHGYIEIDDNTAVHMYHGEYSILCKKEVQREEATVGVAAVR